MKSLLLSLLTASTATAHYTFPELVVNGQKTGLWSYVRKTANYQSNGPVTDITSPSLRCYELAPGTPSQTYTVNAGDSVGFTAASSISHPGPLQVYLARVPAGKTAATFDGSGEVWFKVYSEGATFGAGGIAFTSSGKSQFSLPLPASLPAGDYLLRVEHIALHSASTVGGAQFYISCAQLTVKNGSGAGKLPSSTQMVAFPGAYKATDPGVLMNLYYPVPTAYAAPGPAVWKG